MEDDTPHGGEVETRAELAQGDGSKAKATASTWIREINAAEKAYKKYFERCRKITRRYRDEQQSRTSSNKNPRRYNIFWSIAETQRSHLLQDPPKPYVHRSFLDKDPTARDASLILERCLSYVTKQNYYYASLRAAVDDYMLTARGVSWVYYKSTIQNVPSVKKVRTPPPQGVALTDSQTGHDDEGPYYHPMTPRKVSESVSVGHVLYSNFLHDPAASWELVRWVARRELLTRDELRKRFGEIGGQVPLSASCEEETARPPEEAESQLFKRGVVYEIWDKTTKGVYWICPDFPDSPLDVRKDLYGLSDFFPCPRPAYGTQTTDSLIPIPDFAIWQHVLDELDDVTDRIHCLTRDIKSAWVFDKRLGADLSSIANAPDGKWIGAEASALSGGGMSINDGIYPFPYQNAADVVVRLRAYRAELLQELYELSGMADIMRGASDYRETAAAQQAKADFSGMRIRQRQRCVAAHARQTLQLLGELIAKHFDPAEIKRLSSAEQLFTKKVMVPAPMPAAPPQRMGPQEPQMQPQQAPPAPPMLKQEVFDEERFMRAVTLLKNEVGRQLRVEIDTETLGGQRLAQDQAQRRQALDAMTGAVNAAAQSIQQTPNLGPVMIKLLEFAVRSHPMGRGLEADLTEAIEKFAKEGPGRPPEQQQGKSPQELQLESQKIQIEQQRLQIEQARIQLEAQRLRAEEQEKAGRLRIDEEGRQRDSQIRYAKTIADNEYKSAQVGAQLDIAKAQSETARRGQDIQIAKLRQDANEAATDREHDADKALASILAEQEKARIARQNSFEAQQ